MTTLHAVSLATAPQQIMAALESELNARVFERGQQVRGMLLALAAGEHVYLGGAPGTGKTYIGNVLAGLIYGAEAWSQTYHAFSVPDETQGILDPSLMMQGRLIRRTEGTMAECHLAQLDELFKANSGCLGVFTDILVDGVVKQEGQRIAVPLLQALAASNELPALGEGLAYLWDRFMLRYWLPDDVSDATQKKIMRLRKGRLALQPVCSLSDIQAIRDDNFNAIDGHSQEEAIDDGIIDIKRALRQEGFKLSPRRVGRLRYIVFADMHLFGAGLEDALLHVADSAWDRIEDRGRTLAIVSKLANPNLGVAVEAHDAAKEQCDAIAKMMAEYRAKLSASPTSAATLQTEYLGKINEAKERIGQAADRVAALGSTGAIGQKAAEVRQWFDDATKATMDLLRGGRKAGAR